MGIETTGMDLAEQERKKVTLPGQAGHQGAWDTGSIVEGVASDPNQVARVMQERDIVRQIGEQSFNDIDAITDRIAEALINKPELAQDPHFKLRAEAARDRLNKLIQQGLH